MAWMELARGWELYPALVPVVAFSVGATTSDISFTGTKPPDLNGSFSDLDSSVQGGVEPWSQCCKSSWRRAIGAACRTDHLVVGFA